MQSVLERVLVLVLLRRLSARHRGWLTPAIGRWGMARFPGGSSRGVLASLGAALLIVTGILVWSSALITYPGGSSDIATPAIESVVDAVPVTDVGGDPYLDAALPFVVEYLPLDPARIIFTDVRLDPAATWLHDTRTTIDQPWLIFPEERPDPWDLEERTS